MNKILPIQHFLRSPKYPIIVEINGCLFCGNSALTLAKHISKISNLNEQTYRAVDSAGEGWGFYPDQWVLSPLTLKKRWTKLEVITLYNERKNKDSGNHQYSEKSLSSKRFDKIMNDINKLLSKT